MFEFLFHSDQWYLLFIINIMIISAIFKQHHIFQNVYYSIQKRFHNKKFLIIILSALSGILPIPGRSAVSAMMLSNLENIRKDSKSYKNLGIVDFLATHHYYWWSPLEKTVIIPMAAFGLSYFEFLRITCIPVLVSILFLLAYIHYYISNDDLLEVKEYVCFSQCSTLLYVYFPLCISLFVIIPEYIQPHIVFTVLMIYYMIIFKYNDWKKIIRDDLNYQLIITLFVVINISRFLKSHSFEIESVITNILSNDQQTKNILLITVSIISFISSFLLGSSSKYISFVVILTSYFGTNYILYFLTIEFAGYILSPSHKCLFISQKYFNTPIEEFYKVLIIWSSILILIGILSIN